MNLVVAIPFLTIIMLIGLTNVANADFIANESFLVEGSGFAVTQKQIKLSEIDMLISTTEQTGSRIPIVVVDGFITLDENDFVISNMKGEVLREGRFLRLIGTAENSIGNQITISIFGRLVENSEEGSIYSLTGGLSEGILSNKIVYTAKISQLVSSVTTPQPSTTSTPQTSKPSTGETAKEFTFTIMKGAHSRSFDLDYRSAAGVTSSFVESQSGLAKARYVVPTDRLIVTPGTTLYFKNDDSVSHTIVSATRDTTRGERTPIPDGRFTTGEIPPRETKSIEITEIGFIFLTDPKNTWIKIDITSFPEDSRSITLGSGKK
jgi:plastocyanin